MTDDLNFYWRLRDEPKIFEWLLRARQLAQQTGQKQREANVLKAIGDVQSFHDDKDAALRSYDEALKLFTQVGDKFGQANVRLSKGQMTDDPAEFEEAIRLYEEIGDRYSVASGKAYYGLMLLDSSEEERGAELMREAREGWAAIKYENGVQWIDELLAEGIDELLAEDEEDEDAE